MGLSIYSETQGKFLSAKTPCLQRQGDTLNQHRWCWSDIPRLLLTISSGCLFLSLASPWKITGRAREKLRHYYSTGLGFTIRGRARQFYPSSHYDIFDLSTFSTLRFFWHFGLLWSIQTFCFFEPFLSFEHLDFWTFLYWAIFKTFWSFLSLWNFWIFWTKKTFLPFQY